MDQTTGPQDTKRRMPRLGCEMIVRCKQGLTRSTLMLKDMTRFGARIEGLDAPREGEVISVMLPGQAPRMAFVMWAKGSMAGLEFGDPLDTGTFEGLIRDYALGCQPHAAPAAASLGVAA